MDLINILLQEAVYFQQVNNPDDALTEASIPASGSFIDVRGFHRFGFIIPFGAVEAALTLQLQQATANNGTLKDVEGCVVTVAADGDDKLYIVECDAARLDINNGYKFVTLTVDMAASDDVDAAAIIFFGIGKKVPVTQHAGVVLGANLVG